MCYMCIGKKRFVRSYCCCHTHQVNVWALLPTPLTACPPDPSDRRVRPRQRGWRPATISLRPPVLGPVLDAAAPPPIPFAGGSFMPCPWPLSVWIVSLWGGSRPLGRGGSGQAGGVHPQRIPWGVAFGVVSEGQGVKWLSECWFLHKERRGGPEPPSGGPRGISPRQAGEYGGEANSL